MKSEIPVNSIYADFENQRLSIESETRVASPVISTRVHTRLEGFASVRDHTFYGDARSRYCSQFVQPTLASREMLRLPNLSGRALAQDYPYDNAMPSR